ncbi:hypothetical protein LguiB_002646 [Lonicera macranthoides]
MVFEVIGVGFKLRVCVAPTYIMHLRLTYATMRGKFNFVCLYCQFVRNVIAKSSHSVNDDESLRASFRGSSPSFRGYSKIREEYVEFPFYSLVASVLPFHRIFLPSQAPGPSSGFEAAKAMSYTDLLDEAEPKMLGSEEFLYKFHNALLEIHLVKGALICPEILGFL